MRISIREALFGGEEIDDWEPPKGADWKRAVVGEFDSDKDGLIPFLLSLRDWDEQEAYFYHDQHASIYDYSFINGDRTCIVRLDKPIFYADEKNILDKTNELLQNGVFEKIAKSQNHIIPYKDFYEL